MASLGSSIRSAARGTSSAYRRLPIRWRLAGGSAALTLVILCGFAAIVGVLTTRRIQDDFNDSGAPGGRRPRPQDLAAAGDRSATGATASATAGPNLDDYAATQDAVVRIVFRDDTPYRESLGAPDLGPPRFNGPREIRGYRVETRAVPIEGFPGALAVQYARRVSDFEATANRVRVFLAFGVLGGALLALLAGLATARRAMEPIAELTAAAREVERSRDPTVRIPRPQSDDEVAELARTLESMLARARLGAGGDRVGAPAPARVRGRRVARAAHAADLRARQPRAARGGARRRAARGGGVGAALVAPHAPARRRPAAAGPGRRRAGAAAPARRPLRRGHRRRGRAGAGGRRPRDLGLRAAGACGSTACRTSCTGSC